MHSFKVALVGAFAGTLMACNAASSHAGPLLTNVAAMKSMTADEWVQVRWDTTKGLAGTLLGTDPGTCGLPFEHYRPYGYRWRH